jgi:hypothetical protein
VELVTKICQFLCARIRPKVARKWKRVKSLCGPVHKSRPFVVPGLISRASFRVGFPLAGRGRHKISPLEKVGEGQRNLFPKVSQEIHISRAVSGASGQVLLSPTHAH